MRDKMVSKKTLLLHLDNVVLQNTNLCIISLSSLKRLSGGVLSQLMAFRHLKA